MDKEKIQEKARDVAKFTYEVIDDIFGKRILIFAYILAAILAGTVLFQVFTKYVYEEGFSTADALVATVIHTFTKIWGGILYGVLPGFGVFIVLYVVAKCIRNKNLRLKTEAEKRKAEQEAKWREEDAARAAKEIEELGRLEWETEKMLMDMEIKNPVDLVSDTKADDEPSLKPKQSGPQKFGVANIEIKKKEFRALFTPAMSVSPRRRSESFRSVRISTAMTRYRTSSVRQPLTIRLRLLQWFIRIQSERITPF